MGVKIGSLFWIWIAIILLMVMVIGSSLALRHVQSKILPLVISGIVLILAAVALGTETCRGRLSEVTPAAEKGGEEEDFGGSWSRYWVGMGWLAGFLVAIYLVGFLIAMPLFILLSMRRLGAKWLSATLFAGLTTALMHGIFDVLLRVTLHRGFLPGLLG